MTSSTPALRAAPGWRVEPRRGSAISACESVDLLCQRAGPVAPLRPAAAQAAAQIRHDRGATPQNKAYFAQMTLPTDPAMINALVRGVSNLLTLLDKVLGEDLEAAA
jgi:hypothetical protein